MISFEAQKGSALSITITVKAPEGVKIVWYSLMEMHRKFPREILKVSHPVTGDSNTFEVIVDDLSVSNFESYVQSLGCNIDSKKRVTTVRPILNTTKQEVVVLPAVTGIYDSDIETE